MQANESFGWLKDDYQVKWLSGGQSDLTKWPGNLTTHRDHSTVHGQWEEFIICFTLMNISGFSFPSGQSLMKPLYHCWIVSSSYLTKCKVRTCFKRKFTLVCGATWCWSWGTPHPPCSASPSPPGCPSLLICLQCIRNTRILEQVWPRVRGWCAASGGRERTGDCVVMTALHYTTVRLQLPVNFLISPLGCAVSRQYNYIEVAEVSDLQIKASGQISVMSTLQ